MRLLLATLVMVLGLAATALAQSTDLRAPDQRVAPTQQPVAPTDLRAPDQRVAPTQQSAPTQDFRAPDQQALVAAPTPPVVAPDSADGPAALVFVLIGLGAALVLLAGAGGYFGARYRRRAALADADLVVQ
jgi:hypothetical protein